jgi:hypothetical protein
LESITMTWSEEETLEEETLKAAEKTSSLSELLGQKDFFEQNALRWLRHQDIGKFLDAIDLEESTRLLRFAATWLYAEKEGDTKGFPLLDWLWVIGPGYDWERKNLYTSDNRGAGWKLVARLAELQPDWVGRWWRWRCTNGKGFSPDLTSLEDAVINALTQSDCESHLSSLTDEMVAAIIRRKPEFIGILPPERCGLVLRLALDGKYSVSGVVEMLSKHGIPSDAITIIDGILGSSNQSDAISRLNELVTKWQYPSGSDPIAVAMTQGHERLDTLFRSRWHVPNQSSGKGGDDNLWKDQLWRHVGNAFASAVHVVPEEFKLELGFSIGLRIAEEAEEPSLEKVSEHLQKVGIAPSAEIVNVLLPMVELWSALRTLAKYEANSWQHDTELVGLRTKVASLATVTPPLWAQSLPWILFRSSKLGEVAQAVTLELATISPEVRSALDNACSHQVEQVRLKASGLRTLLLGIEDPESGLARTLADAAAHHMDGTPVFPHPLAPVSATWLGSIGVEQAIADGVRRATNRFAAEVRDQGGDIEEALTKALVKEIEIEFREVQPRLKLFGSSRSRSPAPILSVQQRPSSKRIEEPVYGCDLAWLLNATVRGRYTATWVDLVQVKKFSVVQRRRNATSRTDSWRIDFQQLNDILKWSATAAYWLIASGGEVLVIPAKHLVAIRRGTEKSAKAETFTVGYHEIRSAAIPLEQYLVDLLIGQWVGTTSEDVVRFARGENTNIRPRLVVEVTISVGNDNQ